MSHKVFAHNQTEAKVYGYLRSVPKVLFDRELLLKVLKVFFCPGFIVKNVVLAFSFLVAFFLLDLLNYIFNF